MLGRGGSGLGVKNVELAFPFRWCYWSCVEVCIMFHLATLCPVVALYLSVSVSARLSHPPSLPPIHVRIGGRYDV